MANPLRILIVDDEPPARRRLRELLADCAPAIATEVVGEAGDGHEALDLAQSLAPALLLLDIRMPGMDGLECAGHLQKFAPPPAVIFTTAYDAHACEAFELNAIDYLLKPVRAERLARALGKAHTLGESALAALRSTHRQPRSHLSVNEKGRVVLIPLADILYLKAELKYVTIRTAAREFLLEESLARLEQEFGATFVRIHRNCLVARARIREVGKRAAADDGHVLHLDGLDETLAVSRRQYAAFRERLRTS